MKIKFLCKLCKNLLNAMSTSISKFNKEDRKITILYTDKNAALRSGTLYRLFTA